MRLKIIAGNFIAVLAVGLVSFFLVRSSIQGDLASEVDSGIQNNRTLFDRSWTLSAIRFRDNVEDRAGTPAVRGAFSGLDEDSRRRRASEAANDVGRWFGDPARGRQGPPDLVAVVDNTGRVLARNVEPNQMFGRQLQNEIPALRAALADDEPRHDVWRNAEQNKVFEVAAAPIRNDQQGVIGALVVAYDLSNGLAAAESAVLGRDVAFLADGKVYSSSLSGGSGEALGAFLFGGSQADQTRAALTGTEDRPVVTNPWEVDLGGAVFVGVAATLPMAPNADVGYAVLASKSARMAPAGAANIILVLMALGMLGVLLYGFMIGSSFLAPVEEIEEGVLAVINGNTDLRLDVKSSEFGGLAFRINQLINVFTGVAEADSEGRVSAAPPAMDDLGDSPSAAPQQAAAPAASAGGGEEVVDDPALAAQLSAEPEDAYYARIYREYVQAKSAAGENVSGIPQDRFVLRLKGNESNLVKKYGCRMVRFQVVARGNQVTLKPVLVR